MKKVLIIMLLIFNVKEYIFSQEIKESEGSIENAQILIEKNKIIKLPEVKKPGADSVEKNNEFEAYKISFTPKKINLIQKEINSGKVKNYLMDKKIFDNYENTFSVHYGNYKSVSFNSYHTINLLDNLYFNATIDHNSNKKGSTNDENSGFYDSKIILNSYFNYSNHDFDLNLSYNRVKTFYYGFINETSELISKDDIALRNSFIKYDVSINSAYDELFGFDPKLFYNIHFNNVNFNSFIFNEYSSIINSEINYHFNNKLKAYLLFDNYYRNLKKNNSFISISDQKRNNMLLTYLVNYKLKNLELNVGVIYDIDSKSKEKNFYPKIDLNYSNNKGYFIKLFLDGGDDTNFYYKRLEENPFLYNLDFKYIDLIEKINYGINLGARIFNNKGKVKIHYNEKKLNNFFVYGKSTDDKVFSNSNTFDIYRYSIFYDSGEVHHRKINLYLDYSKNNFINSSFIFVYNNYSLNNFSYPSNIPKYELYLSNEININKFIITGHISSYIDTYSIDINNKAEKLENYLSIDFNIIYSLLENAKVNLKLNNILDSTNEIYYKYPDLGFNLKFGFIYSLK